MGRFSWLSSHLQNHKHKKSPQPSFEEMIKKLQLGSPNYTPTNSRLPEALVGGNDASSLGNDTKHVTLSPRNLRSGEYDAESCMDSVQSEMGNLRRSFSVGCDLDQQRRIFDDDKTDDCIDQMSSFEGSHDGNGIVDLSLSYVSKSADPASPHQDQESLQSPSPRCSSDLVNHESIFSFPNAKYLDKEGYKDCHEEYVDGHDRKTSETSRMSKSYSMPNFGGISPTSPQNTSSALIPHNRSSEDLNIHSIKEEDIPAYDAPAIDTIELNNNDSFYLSEKFDGENAAFDNYDSLDYGHSSKEWIVPDDVGIRKHRLEGSSSNHWSHFPGQDLKFKRIEDWVNDIQHCSPVEETNETASSSNQLDRGSALLDGLDKVETNLNPGTEAAKRYISSLNATATSVQLANHGLVAIPLLGAFGSLKVLNLSGNSIVRITAGALPRGLHMLNFSKNKISTIEGLRELTRLRVLDLSYNKISRIGHGLASCSSVKELYLAGNKISEVEGLHRLLKLAVVDLRFNKIATSKSLGQLAANYNSLQAISLEGNPAQRNVGDDQLKKYLQSLLPNLAYYNRKHTKTSTLKDSSGRAVRLGISDHKSSARRSFTKRASHSSVHGQKSHASDSSRQAKGKHGLVPPSSSRVTCHHDLVKAGPSLQKSRSEGTLAQNQAA